jgi:hypothetical protein
MISPAFLGSGMSFMLAAWLFCKAIKQAVPGVSSEPDVCAHDFVEVEVGVVSETRLASPGKDALTKTTGFFGATLGHVTRTGRIEGK